MSVDSTASSKYGGGSDVMNPDGQQPLLISGSCSFEFVYDPFCYDHCKIRGVE